MIHTDRYRFVMHLYFIKFYASYVIYLQNTFSQFIRKLDIDNFTPSPPCPYKSPRPPR